MLKACRNFSLKGVLRLGLFRVIVVGINISSGVNRLLGPETSLSVALTSAARLTFLRARKDLRQVGRGLVGVWYSYSPAGRETIAPKL